MKEITILSGKGGTGKTSISAAFASIAENAILCDNDVDASDLHLILQPEIKEEHTFFSSWILSINHNKCDNCGMCKDNCRFEAIYYNKESNLQINPYQCEGCRLCERICPVQAISSRRNEKNYWYVSKTRFGILVHAKMGPGEENSGKLVTQVRKRAKEIAVEKKAKFIINDGPPGIGCATISSLAGTSIVLIVLEPTKSALHDAIRLYELVRTFNIKVFAIINKYDINKQISEEIEHFLKTNYIPLLGKLPFNIEIVEAMINRNTIVEYKPEIEVSNKIKKIWHTLSA